MCRKKVSLALGISMLPVTLALLPVTIPIILAGRAWARRKNKEL